MKIQKALRTAITRIQLIAMIGIIFGVMAPTSQAGLVEYQTNSTTLHLWHFDEVNPGPGFVDITNGYVLAQDACAFNPQNPALPGIMLSNLNGPNLTITPTAFGWSGVPSYTNALQGFGYGNCISNHIGTAWIMDPAGTQTTSGNTTFVGTAPYTNIDQYVNTNTGAFTWEAIVQPSFPIVNGGTLNGVEDQLIYGDNGQRNSEARGPAFYIGGGGVVFQMISQPGSPTVTFPLPTTGPDVAVPGQWYHIAVTYSGYPTNITTFYWTLIDPARTNCDILGTNAGTIASTASGVTPITSYLGTPVLMIGGNARGNVSGFGNSGFQGLIDEVRLSDVALNSNQMAFNNSTIVQEPVSIVVPTTTTNVPLAFGTTLALTPVEFGSAPVTNQWYQILNGVTNALSFGTNKDLVMGDASTSAGGVYFLAAKNAYGSTNSALYFVSVTSAPFDSLFNSGVDGNGYSLCYYAPGSIDPHWTIPEDPDPSAVGSNATVWAPAPLNADYPADTTNACWIGPEENQGAVEGTYEYQTTFLIDAGSSNNAALSGNLLTAGTTPGGTIQFSLNGVAVTNIPNGNSAIDNEVPFTLNTGGFLNGSNVLDITFANTVATPYGVTVENLVGLCTAYTNAPIVTNQPTSVTVPYGTTAQFSLVAFGAPTMSYQWFSNNLAVTSLSPTNRVLNVVGTNFSISEVNSQDQFTNYFHAVVSDGVGSTTSAVVKLTVTVPPLTLTSVGVPIWNATNNETTIVVYFSLPVDPVTGATAGNYSLGAGNPTVTSAVLGSAPGEVILTLSTPLTVGISYTLTVQNVKSAQFGLPINPSPTSLAVGMYPNVVLWLKASEGIVPDGSGGVGAWSDLSTNGNNLTISPGVGFGDPLYVTNAYGFPVVRFSTASYSYLGAPSTTSLAITNNMSLFAVVNFATLVGGTNGEIVSKTGTPNLNIPAPYDYYAGSSSVAFYRGNGSVYSYVHSTVTPTATVPQLLDVVMNGTQVTHRLNGNANGTGTLSTLIADQGQPLYLGMRSDGAQGLTGDMQELILIGGALSATDVSNVENYLVAEYNLATGTNSYPIITQEPVTSTNINQNTTLTVPAAATGTPAVAYQWYDTDNILQVGQTNATLVISNDMVGDSYYLIVTNVYASVTSSVVAVTVNAGLNVTLGPPSVTVYAGQPFTMAAQASGTFPFYYQWYNGATLIPGATSASYTVIVPVGSTSYYCTVTNGYGGITSTQAGPVTVTSIAAPTTLYQMTVLSNNPVAFWRLNEGPDNGNGNDGTIAYDYAGGHDGTYTNAVLAIPGIDTAADPDTAALFGYYNAAAGNTNNSYVSEINNTSSGFAPINFAEPVGSNAELSVETWVCETNTNGGGIVAKGYGNGGEQFDLDMNANAFRFFVRDASGNTHGSTSTVIPVMGQWYHVVGVFDGANGAVHLYVNGVDVADQTGIANGVGLLATTTNGVGLPSAALVSIGARTSSKTTSNYDLQFQGNIQDVALYNYVLSPQQVFTHYLAGAQDIVFSAASTNIVASYSAATKNLTLSWPINHTGWTLQAQTNAVSVGISTNWVNVSGSASGNQAVIPINFTNGTVFYRLIYTP